MRLLPRRAPGSNEEGCGEGEPAGDGGHHREHRARGDAFARGGHRVAGHADGPRETGDELEHAPSGHERDEVATQHPHLAHEFLRSIVEGRPALVDEETAANWTCVGICAHQSAMKGGERGWGRWSWWLGGG